MHTQNIVAHKNHKEAKKLLKSYLVGFLLAVILAIAAYMMVTEHMLKGEQLYFAIAAFGLLQLLIQTIFFLRLNAASSDDQWHLISFLFTLLIIAIVVVGSLWIMYNLNYYMVN